MTPLGAEMQDQVMAQCLMHENLKNVAGEFHSSMSTNINDHIFFVDQRHFYLYNFQSKTSKIYKD